MVAGGAPPTTDAVPLLVVALVLDEIAAALVPWAQVHDGPPPVGVVDERAADAFTRLGFGAEVAEVARLLRELEKLALTPTYHVFDLYQAHQGAQRAELIFDVRPPGAGRAPRHHARRADAERPGGTRRERGNPAFAAASVGSRSPITGGMR